MRLEIKPLSVNEAWRGRRFKTPKYKKYEQAVLLMLPRMNIPKDKHLEIKLEFGFSSAASDVDNPVKCFIDCLQKKYCFNDKNVYRLLVEKKLVKKGSEYIFFEINTMCS